MALSRRQKALLVLLGVVLSVALPVALVAGESFIAGFFSTTGTTHWNATSGPEVVVPADYSLQSGNPFTGASFNLSTESNGWVNVSADAGGGVLTVDQINGTTTNVSSVDTAGTNITIHPDDKNFTRLKGSFSSVKFYETAVEDGQVDITYDADDGTSDIAVETDATPGTQYGLVDADTNTVISSAGVAGSDGVVRFDNVESGEHSAEIQELGTVYIRNVTPPHDLIENADVEIIISGSQQTVDIQTVDDGQIDMTGLPITESYIFVVDAPNYHARSVVVQDIASQDTVFLLNESFTSTQAAFLVTDLTGEFSSPLMTVDRIINRSEYNGSPAGFSWTTIGGDRLGADAKHVMNLEKGARYRITIKNQQGDSRVLGEYTAEFNETVELEVGKIIWEAPPSDDYRVQSNQTELASGNEQIIFQYQDGTENTSELCITIHERGNTSNVLYPEDCQTYLGTYKISVMVTGDDLNTTWVANWSAVQAGENIGSTVPLGKAGEIGLPIDSKWLGPIVLIGLIGLLSAAPKTGARTGAVIVVALAFGLTWWGWVDIPGPALAVAGALALLGKAADFNSFRG